MGLLEQNKRDKKGNKNVVVTTRLTEDEAKKFTDLCDATDFRVAEAVRMLILNEIYPERQSARQAPKPKPRSENVEDLSETAEMADVASLPKPTRPQPRPYNPVAKLRTTRFTTNEWKVGSQLPCPLCHEWKTATNFARHADTAHGMTTQQMFEEYKEEADRMVAQLKELEGIQ